MTVEELRKDLESLVAQANAMAGAINYIRQKIAMMEKPQNGKAETTEVPNEELKEA